MSFESYALNELSLASAEEIVPPDFLPAYRWFQENEGVIAPRPWRDHKPEGIDVRMVAESGIQKPAHQRYAISITSSGYSAYSDQPVQDLGNGTWVYKYCEHTNTYGGTSPNRYNDALLACFHDGVPVGVFIKQHGSDYLCLGLAFIERYDPSDGTFELHGPVNSKQSTDMWSVIPESEFDEVTRQIAKDYGFLNEDQRVIKAVEQVQRQRQNQFRDKLLHAYHSTCAITGCNVETTLQAAHICPYRGPQSQLTSNGLLLRADFHLLYDAYLMSISPDDNRVRVGKRLANTSYSEWDKQKVQLPDQLEDRPAPQLLATHFLSFRERNEV